MLVRSTDIGAKQLHPSQWDYNIKSSIFFRNSESVESLAITVMDVIVKKESVANPFAELQSPF